ncbi:putative fasciclin-like arabinogalactan protein 20 [Coffea arabica]|uniref:Fasciclin-like arabinogalactan protein 20 n=1 Tax=Coffea arabica TaxID=13443 RepID=A0A6P6V8F1_COFAR|nr:putative fasciclin-like arabinogalactan protein 20 [Coffea arabica]
MASLTVFLSLLTLFSLLSLAQLQSPPPSTSPQPQPPPPSPPQSLLNAAETLSNSGYNAMSLTLNLLLDQPRFISFPSSLTIFTPPDSAFAAAGQPSLSLLLLHFSPLSLSLESLSSLPFSSPIPTLSRTHASVFITTSSENPTKISINNVEISGSPVYDDGSVVVFAVENFFEPNFALPAPQSVINPNPECVKFSTFSRYKEASGVLKSRGYSIFATFLDLQLMGFVDSDKIPSENETKLTIFAPVDEALIGDSGNFLEYSSIFLRHLLPCKLNWNELNGIANETVFRNYVEELSMKIQKSGDKVMINGVEITAPGLYENEGIAIHGVREMIPVLDDADEDTAETSFMKVEKKNVEGNCPSPDRSEF